jgi:hypothetical protein
MVAGRPHSLWYLAGRPGAGVAPNPGINGEILTAPVSGALDFTNPVTGNSNLSAFTAGCGQQGGQLLLVDRIWQNSGINVTSTSLQSISGDQIPNRDRDGQNVGYEVYAGVEVSTATGAGTPTITLSYTNTAGQPKTGTNTISTVASSIAGTFYPISLAAGDKGVQAVTGITLSATWTSGVIHVVLYRVIARLPLLGAGIPNSIDMYSGGFPRIYDDSVLSLIYLPSTTTSSNISGNLIVAQG